MTKKTLLLAVAMTATLGLAGCLSQLQQAYLECHDTGASHITKNYDGDPTAFFNGSLVDASGSSRSYDCKEVLANQDVKQQLKDKGYLKQ